MWILFWFQNGLLKIYSDSLQPMDCSSPGTSVHGDSPGGNIGMGCHPLLQEFFPTQESNPGLPHCRQILYYLSHQGSPSILPWVAYPFSRVSSWPGNRTPVSCLAEGFFTSWATREAHYIGWAENKPEAGIWVWSCVSQHPSVWFIQAIPLSGPLLHPAAPTLQSEGVQLDIRLHYILPSFRICFHPGAQWFSRAWTCQPSTLDLVLPVPIFLLLAMCPCLPSEPWDLVLVKNEKLRAWTPVKWGWPKTAKKKKKFREI